MKYLVLVIFLVSISFLAYIPEQNDFSYILVGFGCAFVCFLYLTKTKEFSFHFLIGIALLVRFGLIFSFPNLSDDIYRFIWDGKLLHMGISPYSYLPYEILEDCPEESIFVTLFPVLNSAEYHSVYPPFSQFIFYLSKLNYSDNLLYSSVIIKSLLFIAECLTIFTGIHVLKELSNSKNQILWYALNPLVIVEIMGNAHFEGFMICFFVLFLSFLFTENMNRAVVFISLSIATKLVPALFLPWFIFIWDWKKLAVFYAKVGLILSAIFIPVIYEAREFGTSLNLYFQKFEFNASIYYVIRTIGQWITGFNPIEYIGPALGVLLIGVVFWLSVRIKKGHNQFIIFALLSVTSYLLLSTTIHPWYVCLLVLLSSLSGYKFPLYWSALIVLSYSKYYNLSMYYWLVALEYLVLFFFIYREREKIFDNIT